MASRLLTTSDFCASCLEIDCSGSTVREILNNPRYADPRVGYPSVNHVIKHGLEINGGCRSCINTARNATPSVFELIWKSIKMSAKISAIVGAIIAIIANIATRDGVDIAMLLGTTIGIVLFGLGIGLVVGIIRFFRE